MFACAARSLDGRVLATTRDGSQDPSTLPGRNPSLRERAMDDAETTTREERATIIPDAHCAPWSYRFDRLLPRFELLPEQAAYPAQGLRELAPVEPDEALWRLLAHYHYLEDCAHAAGATSIEQAYAQAQAALRPPLQHI